MEGGMITNFSLDSFSITDTRSRHNDTDFVTVNITVGTDAAITQNRAMGDVNNGTHPVGLGVSAEIPTDADVPVVFSYVILNNGHGDPSLLQKGAQTALSALGTAGAKAATSAVGGAVGAAIGTALGTIAVPVIGSAIGALSGWAVGEVGSILFADCDGPVAIGMHVYTSKQLIQNTAGGQKITGTVEHPGTDSATGCGGNSKYSTTDTISTLATIDTVIDLNGQWASGGVPGPVISVNGGFFTVDMSAYHRPPASGSIVDSSNITVNFPDDKTYTGILQQPNTIKWSNNSVWTKVATIITHSRGGNLLTTFTGLRTTKV
jgi:hypothetical protein